MNAPNIGGLAQLGERLAGSQKVRGSSPLSSTFKAVCDAADGFSFWFYAFVPSSLKSPCADGCADNRVICADKPFTFDLSRPTLLSLKRPANQLRGIDVGHPETHSATRQPQPLPSANRLRHELESTATIQSRWRSFSGEIEVHGDPSTVPRKSKSD